MMLMVRRYLGACVSLSSVSQASAALSQQMQTRVQHGSTRLGRESTSHVDASRVSPKSQRRKRAKTKEDDDRVILDLPNDDVEDASAGRHAHASVSSGADANRLAVGESSSSVSTSTHDDDIDNVEEDSMEEKEDELDADMTKYFRAAKAASALASRRRSIFKKNRARASTEEEADEMLEGTVGFSHVRSHAKSKKEKTVTNPMKNVCGTTDTGSQILTGADGCCPSSGWMSDETCPWHCVSVQKAGGICSCSHCCADRAIMSDNCATLVGCAFALGRANNDTAGLSIESKNAISGCLQCVGGEKYCHTTACEASSDYRIKLNMRIPSTTDGGVWGEYDECAPFNATANSNAFSKKSSITSATLILATWLLMYFGWT